MTKCIISQKEQVAILEAYRKMRKSHRAGTPFFMLVQYVPVGINGGKAICRPVSAPVVSSGK